MNKKPKVFAAMSGGVDSSVAALLLKREGYDVTGVHMICWDGCENNGDKLDAMRVAAHLDIPFLVWDFRKKYREAVFNYMISGYREGLAPNPDVMCNKKIKFGIFLEKALEMGADFIATGHYVKASPDDTRSGGPWFFSAEKTLKTRAVALRTSSISDISGEGRNRANAESASEPPERGLSREAGARFRHSLLTAKDSNKDQSYFLWTLTQDQLQHSLFPVGGYLKSEVREIARKAGLSVAEKKDSQGLCFVGKVDFGDFLRETLPKREGAIVNSAGKIIGRHDGAEFFTIGQRHGLNIGGMPEPMYVAGRDILTNTLTVAENAEDPILYKKELSVYGLNWIHGASPELPISCLARIRYRQPLQKCIFSSNGRVIFDEPQRAVAPGQSIVFYSVEEGGLPEGRQMLGGGIIN